MNNEVFNCTCGNTNLHVIMRRMTADGIEVNLWENGAITGLMGVGFKGVPLARSSAPANVEKAKALGYLFMGEVELYDQKELPALYRAAKKAISKDGLPGTLRKFFQNS